MSTLALCAICKNEENHIKRWLSDWEPLVDKIYITDTGSTDHTLEIIKEFNSPKVVVRHFEWINDFSAARNASIENVEEDYIFWNDCDDSPHNVKGFLDWRKEMERSDLWLVVYHYAKSPDGKPMCSFIRERVFKNNGKCKFEYPIHEGIKVDNSIRAQITEKWAIQHLRTLEDLQKDKGRNLKVFEQMIASGKPLDARMQWYYGKELFEGGGDRDLALKNLLYANMKPELETHDRTLCMQYACYILIEKQKYAECIDLAQAGLMIAPSRAEFYVMIGDCHLKQEQIMHCIPSFAAAKSCVNPALEKQSASFIFDDKNAYGSYPRKQLVRAYMVLGKQKEALAECEELNALFPDEEAKMLLQAIIDVKATETAVNSAPLCEDVVFTCLGGLYEWDENVARTRGIGGSEVACVEMAKEIAKLTKRRVVVFNAPRVKGETMPSGVEYRPVSEMHKYFTMHKPTLHIAWRHNVKLTAARTLVWCHDLFYKELQQMGTYEAALALSEFHKELLFNLGLPEEKIWVTRNGINPIRFEGLDITKKNPHKLIFASSPDRGLERAIAVCDIIRTQLPVELHVFYGLDNMKAMGKADEAAKYEELMASRPWVKYHGNVEQSKLPKLYQDAAIWLYPSNFQETFCITAIEAALCGVYPVVRKFGALSHTLKDIPSTIIDNDCVTLEEHMKYAEAVIAAIKGEKWKELQNLDAEAYSWRSIAKEWAYRWLPPGMRESVALDSTTTDSPPSQLMASV